MILAIRVDDFGWTTTPTPTPPIKEPDVGFQLAQRFHEAMSGLPYLAAIIPANLDEAAQSWLDSKPAGLTPAVHGWDHGAERPSSRDEFEGRTIPFIRDQLDRGRRLLGDTRHYVPPYNALSGRVIDACFHEGLHVIWGGPIDRHTPPEPCTAGGVTLIPAWLPLYGATCGNFSSNNTTLLDVLPRMLATPGHAVLCLHLTWEFSHDQSLDGLRRLCDLLRADDSVVSPDAFVAAITR